MDDVATGVCSLAREVSLSFLHILNGREYADGEINVETGIHLSPKGAIYPGLERKPQETDHHKVEG